MKHVACFALFTLLPSLALAQVSPTPPSAMPGAPPATPPGYPPPGYYAPPPGYYPPPPGYEARETPSGANLTGFTFAVGVGYGVPFGDVLKTASGATAKMSDGLTGETPFSISAGFRAAPMVSFGLAFQYAPILTNSCPAGKTCTASDTAVAGELRLHFVPEQSFSPWIAGEVGYEWLGVSSTGSSDATIAGWQFGVQAGGDVRVSPFMTLGPFVGLRVGTYSSVSSGGRSADVPDDQQATHGWVLFGLRGTFTFGPK